MGAALEDGSGPTVVVLDAADLNVGAIDPFDVLVPLAKSAGAWVHVDGAFGLWARASTRHRHKLTGLERADSWATDGHKWLNTPKDIGIAMVADADAHRGAMRMNAAYLSSVEGQRDQMDWTPEWTRRARGIPVYAALRELGRVGLSDLVDRCCEYARNLGDGIGALEGAELVANATLNQALVRFPALHADATDGEHDARTDAVIHAINAEGTAFFSGTVWKGRRTMRISVVSWRTTTEDIDRTIAAVERVLLHMQE